jgi:8-hydroxy-5-deazaflavin:NADPH oxidoreductase
MPSTKRVGILGSGDVAKALGRGFARHGYAVMLGTRDPSKLDAWKKEVGASGSVGSFTEAAEFGEIAILATQGGGTESAVDLAGPRSFGTKLVIDASNPLDFSHGMPPTLLFGTTDSLGERVQRKLPDAKVVKCFNTVANAQMVDPKFSSGRPPMLICGNDAAAKRRTEELLRELGWSGALDVGGIEGARWLEALVPLWVRAGAALGTFEHMFEAVR